MLKKFLQNKPIIIGMSFILLGYFLFSLNDAMSKLLLQQFSLGQLLLFRSIGSFFILFFILKYEKQTIHDLISIKPAYLHILRVVCTTVDVVFFYIAVIYLPLTDVLTFYMVGPIYVAIVSHFFLNDRLGPWRWIAIFIGFIGVIIALQPTESSFSWPAILALLGGFGFAMLIICNRLLKNTRDSLMVTWQNVVTAVLGIILCFFSWYPISFDYIFIFLVFGATACCAHIFISRAMKFVPTSLVAPTQYTILLWAILFDKILFDHKVEGHVLLGACIIIASSLFIIYRKKAITNKMNKDIS